MPTTQIANLSVRKLSAGVAHMAELFALNEDSSALEELEEILGLVIDYTRNVPETGGDLLQGLLGQALTAMQSRDYVRLSDLLEYVIVPLITEKKQDG